MLHETSNFDGKLNEHDSLLFSPFSTAQARTMCRGKGEEKFYSNEQCQSLKGLKFQIKLLLVFQNF